MIFLLPRTYRGRALIKRPNDVERRNPLFSDKGFRRSTSFLMLVLFHELRGLTAVGRLLSARWRLTSAQRRTLRSRLRLRYQGIRLTLV